MSLCPYVSSEFNIDALEVILGELLSYVFVRNLS